MKFFLATAFILCGALHLSAARAVSDDGESSNLLSRWGKAINSVQDVFNTYNRNGQSVDTNGFGLSINLSRGLIAGILDAAMQSDEVSEETKQALAKGKGAFEQLLQKAGLDDRDFFKADSTQSALGAKITKVAVDATKDLEHIGQFPDVVEKHYKTAKDVAEEVAEYKEQLEKDRDAASAATPEPVQDMMQ